MKLQVLGAGIFLNSELAAFQPPPAWRKATRNMVMATQSIERALAQSALQVAGDPAIGFILGSTSGELETSADFISTWSKSRLARPLLFQNSLHNATTGFASIHFKMTGPSFTMSGLEATPEQCLSMAEMLLAEKSCTACIVTLIEGHNTLANWLGEPGVVEGACTLIVSNLAACQAMGWKARGEIADLKALNYPNVELHVPLVSIQDSGFYSRARNWGAGK
jgi:hypothetical protein